MASIRKNKKTKRWLVSPYKQGYPARRFKYKSQVHKYLSRMNTDVDGTLVSLETYGYGFYWVDQRWSIRLQKGRLHWSKIHIASAFRHLSKAQVCIAAQAYKVESLMMSLAESLDDRKLSNLLVLFYKQGYNLETHPINNYVDHYVGVNLDDVPWVYWADKCNIDRAKCVYDAVKLHCPIAFELYKTKLNNYG